MADESGWLIVGLGNPGPEYASQRHNVGFMVVDALAGRLGLKLSRHRRAHALVAEGRIRPGGARIQLVEPLSFMNRSGGPTSTLLQSAKLPTSHLIVIHDELDLGFGTLRLKQGGGHGGHNGLRDIIAAVGADFIRLRFGIGRPPGQQDAADFVLRPFAASERAELGVLIEEAADAVTDVIEHGLIPTQQRLHSKA